MGVIEKGAIMERIAIISDVHANITALNAVLKDIEKRNVNKIVGLGDYVIKGVNPDKVIDKLKEKCDVMLIGNTDYAICKPEAKNKGHWTRNKIGEERANYIYSLPSMYQFYMSGYLVRLFHATPYSLDGIFNPLFENKKMDYKKEKIYQIEDMFKNTDFLGLNENYKEPDIVGYGHIHTPLLIRYKNKTIFNTGSVGIPVEMQIKDENDKNNKLSTIPSYMILEGNFDSKELSTISFTEVRVKYNIEEEIDNILKSDLPSKEKIIKSLRTAMSEQYM